MKEKTKHEEFEDESFGYEKMASKYGLKISTLYSLVSRRQIPHVRLSKRLVLFSKREIEEWFSRHSIAAN